MSQTILIADDDAHIRDVLTFALRKAGMSTVEAGHGLDALEMARSHAPDLIILDINMPHMDGLEVCRKLRADVHIPILFLSSRDEEIDRILGLELGGDDYVTKPFSPREVVARVNAILKRVDPARRPAEPATVTGHGKLEIDADTYEARWTGTTVSLTATELKLLQTLARRPGKVLTRDQLIDAAYGTGFAISDRTVDSHIRHVRSKFAALGGTDVIDTVQGIGYKLGRCGA